MYIEEKRSIAFLPVNNPRSEATTFSSKSTEWVRTRQSVMIYLTASCLSQPRHAEGIITLEGTENGGTVTNRNQLNNGDEQKQTTWW